MSKANAIFTFEGSDIKIQCLKEDKMEYICQKFSDKVLLNIKSFVFLYGGDSVNFKLSFIEQANSFDKENSEMKIVVYKKETEGFVCPKCGVKIEINTEKIDNIVSSNNDIKDTLSGIKNQLENIINNNSIKSVNVQLKNINALLSNLDEDLSNNNKNLENLLANNADKNNDKINNNLTTELNKYKNENTSLKEEIEKLKNEVKFEINKQKEIIMKQQDELDKKEKEIKDLKNELLNLRKNGNHSNDMLSIHFISMTQDIDVIIQCSKNDMFSSVENKLYNIYPKYKETNNYFLHNGFKIKTNRTINENKIKDGAYISIGTFDF